VFLEFALVLPLLMSLVLGIYTGGQAYTDKIGLVEAVREGARYGASLSLGTDANALTTWKSRVVNRVVDASGGDIPAADVCVEYASPSTATACGLSDPAGASNEPGVHLVKVSATKPAKMEFFFFTRNVTLVGKLVARYERDTG
jgi:Flp pilus assembly protein TadG